MSLGGSADGRSVSCQATETSSSTFDRREKTGTRGRVRFLLRPARLLPAELHIVLTITLALAGCVSRSPAAPVRANDVVPPNAPPALAAHATDKGFVGVVLAPATVDLASQLEARLDHLRVRPGDHVVASEVIAQLDTRTARKELAMAKAAVLAAKAEVRRAEIELAQAAERRERRSAVVELPSGATVSTTSDEDRSTAGYQEKLAATRLQAARASLLDRQAHADELRTLAEEGALRAPFDGVIAERYLDEGTIVRKGTPIVRLIESSGLRVRFAVPEEKAHALEVGLPLRVRVDANSLDGKVEKVAPEIDAAARMVFVDASLVVPDKDQQHVRGGRAARVFLAGVDEVRR